MKAVLVATIGGEKRLYYVIDAGSRSSDGVLEYDGKPKIVNFWDTVARSTDVSPIESTKFHDFLWNGAESDEDDSWVRIFINKTQSVDNRMLSGVTINSDVMKASIKKKSIDSRASEFKTILVTQNSSMVWRKYSG